MKQNQNEESVSPEAVDIFSSFISGLPLTSMLAVILALVGWYFIYTNSRSLQKRSETWAIVKNISDLLQEVEKEAKLFWLDDQSAQNALLYEAKINSFLNEIERWISHLSKRVDGEKNRLAYKNDLVGIFKDSTFDTENIGSMGKTNKFRKIVLIKKHTKNIRKNIDMDFESKYIK